MPPRTRTENQNTNFKVYYSKKPLKQRYFPLRAKKVRRKASNAAALPEPRQTTITAVLKRGNGFVRNSESEEEDESEFEEEGEVDAGAAGLKRRRGAVEEQDEGVISTDDGDGSEEEPVQPPSKRKRRANAVETPVEEPDIIHDPETEDIGAWDSTAESSEGESGDGKPAYRRKSRRERQSTMTQFARGTRPLPGSAEPDFRPVKRPRRSIGREKHVRQKTLTQMVPGMFGGIISDDDMDEELGGLDGQVDDDEVDEGYVNAIGDHLARNGLFQPADGQGKGIHEIPDAEGHISKDAKARSRKRTSPGPESRKENVRPSASVPSETSGPQRPIRSILSTPQKRRMREIPSSQSPAESLLSTQTTPHTQTSPLKTRSRIHNGVLETPSKRKTVTFQDPPTHPTSARRRIGNMVLDSDDEEDSTEDDEATIIGGDIGAETQAMIQHIEHTNVGANTQALLREIDRACANAEEDAVLMSREVSEELGWSNFAEPMDGQDDTPGDIFNSLPNNDTAAVSSAFIKREPIPDDTVQMPPPAITPRARRRRGTTPQASETSGCLPSGPFHIVKQEPQDGDRHFTEPSDNHMIHTQFPSSTAMTERDLDGHPIMVTRSPSPEHSSTASAHPINSNGPYSTYQRLPQPSSHHPPPHNPIPTQLTETTPTTTHPSFHTIPTQPINPIPQLESPTLSQASTVHYEPSPRKPSTQIPRSHPTTPRKITTTSTTTTPHRIPNSQPPLTSPEKPSPPPPLIIPSSVPTPMTATRRRWIDFSSPVLLRRGGGSAEEVDVDVEFSIPALPPGDDEDE